MRRAAGLAIAALLLTTCSSSRPGTPETLPLACPTALLLDGAERTSTYDPGADRRPSALRHLAVLTNLSSNCRFNDQGVDVDLAFDLIAERGPAFAGNSVELTYFIATIGPDRQILSKQLFDSEIVFAGDEEVAGVAEQLTLRLPSITPDEGQDYGVFLGFQLDEAELEDRLRPLVR